MTSRASATAPPGTPTTATDRQPARWLLLPILVLAAFLRFWSLSDRGLFDADQGRDFLILRSMLVDGVLPMLGPPVSVGGVHHGVVYYYLLAPLAWVSALDPTIVAMLFATAGVATVALVWWLARAMGGPPAGLAAGMIFALSPTAVAASVTIWNPNLVPLAASLTMAAAWKAWISRRPRWWALALGASGLTVQLHIAGVLLAVPIIGLLVADVRRTTPGPARRALLTGALAGLGIAVAFFLPLIVHEATTGFSETRAALSFLASVRTPATFDPLTRLLIVVIRLASWPILGLLIDAPALATLLTGVVAGLAAWRLLAASGAERTGARWLVAILAVGAVGLTLLVPDLERVIRGLPNDHYHAFTDPVIAVILGVAAAAAVRPRRFDSRGEGRRILAERALVGVGLAMILVAEVIRLPLRPDPDGGWPAALAAAHRVAGDVSAQTILVVGLPDFKPTGAVLFPLLETGRDVIDGNVDAEGDQAVSTGTGPKGAPGALVVVCDRVFEPVIALACGGPAEDALRHPAFPELVDRFDLSPRTTLSVYVPGGRTGL